jgi:hypothetical protein
MSDIRDIAKAYIDAGWSVVPLVKGEKRASTSWQKKTYTPDDFNDSDGIAGKCGEPSGWRVDVDLDSVEAIEAAKLLLPSTGLIHGRPGKPDSHYWFLCDGIKTSQFTDVRGSDGKTSMLVEIRSTGGYTALPPSIHPSGDVLSWAIERDPMTMLGDDLFGAVRSVAIAALVARHWPGHGATHVAIGPLAGFLSQGGVDSPTVIDIIKAAATIAGGDVKDCLNYATSTVAKFRAGEKVTGAPKLAEALGDEIVAKMRGWLKLADVDAVEEMNQKHFFVTLGTKSVIGRENGDDVMFQPVRELYPEYANRIVQVGTDKNGNAAFGPLFETWLKSPQRRSFSRVVMAPPPLTAADHEYNLWKGFAIEPAPGVCDKFLAHLRDVICSGNEEQYDYLIKWLAFLVQCPGLMPKVAVAMRGRQGTGKGMLAKEMMKRIFGTRHFAHLSRSEELIKWNALVSGKVVVFADEAFFAGDKENTGNLKRIISEDTITIGRKHIDSSEEQNCIHLFMATNEDWAIPAGTGERRYFAIEVSDAHEQDLTYFGELLAEMDNGGAEAFLHFLLNQPTPTKSEIFNCPKTAELANQQAQSAPLHLQWLKECLLDGAIAQIVWQGPVPADRVYDAYKVWVRERTQHFLSSETFARRMSGYLTARTAKPSQVKKRVNGESIRCWELRDLDARRYYDMRERVNTEWPEAQGASLNRSIPF